VKRTRYQWHPQHLGHVHQSNGANHLAHKVVLGGFLHREAWASMEQSDSLAHRITSHQPLKIVRRNGGKPSGQVPIVAELGCHSHHGYQ
jgi:hypothetical protein